MTRVNKMIEDDQGDLDDWMMGLNAMTRMTTITMMTRMTNCSKVMPLYKEGKHVTVMI